MTRVDFLDYGKNFRAHSILFRKWIRRLDHDSGGFRKEADSKVKRSYLKTILILVGLGGENEAHFFGVGVRNVDTIGQLQNMLGNRLVKFDPPELAIFNIFCTFFAQIFYSLHTIIIIIIDNQIELWVLCHYFLIALFYYFFPIIEKLSSFYITCSILATFFIGISFSSEKYDSYIFFPSIFKTGCFSSTFRKSKLWYSVKIVRSSVRNLALIYCRDFLH